MPDLSQLARLFEFSIPVWELVVRGSAMYWFLFLAFRFVVRRDIGSVGIADILILVIVATEVHASLREKGIESLAAVKAMFLEPDGQVSVIKTKSV